MTLASLPIFGTLKKIHTHNRILFFLERVPAESGGGAKGEGESQADTLPSMEPDTGLYLRTFAIMT